MNAVRLSPPSTTGGRTSTAIQRRFRPPVIDRGLKRRWSAFLTSFALLGALSGCGYMVGNAYGPEVRTIEVPVFQNDSFRRGIEYQLTEAVQKEIQTRTPYRLAKGPGADTRLTGRIVDIRKDVLGETQFDDPRELQLSLFIHVTWEDLRTGQLLASQEVPIQPQAIPLVGQAEFAPEVGQSLATATQDATERLARQIVNMLETPW
uniref:LptE family protein n=1 Tax=Schlesneria paludicola TaxID=360056 RepID=A0A7C2NZA9_9PLAN